MEREAGEDKKKLERLEKDNMKVVEDYKIEQKNMSEKIRE